MRKNEQRSRIKHFENYDNMISNRNLIYIRS